MKLNAEKILELVDNGYLIMNKHPQKDLFILNYSKTAQYEQYWNEYTLMCRGLVVDVDFNIIARPFPKFFNLEEHKKSDIPKDLEFEAYEKMDGSLGILFFYDNEWIMATRGSFESEQAIRAKEIFDNYCLVDPYMPDNLYRGYTYLFEIIYPENRIVVDYGDDAKIVLLGAVQTYNGNEMSYEEMSYTYHKSFEIVKKYDTSNDITELRNIEENNREGFVIKYSNGFRVKIKFKEYVRLHRILTNVSTKSIWEALKNGDGLDDIVDAVPDEFFEWVKNTKADFLNKYNDIERNALKEFWRIYVYENRTLKKDFALIAKDYKYSGILFKLYDGKDNYSEYIWKLLKPVYSLPFKDNNDDANVESIEI